MASLVRSFASTRSAVLFVVAAASLAACHKKKPAPAPTPTTTTFNEDSARRAQAYADSVRRAQERARFVADSIDRANRDRASRLAAARTALTAPIFFDYDMAEIRDDARATLESKLPILTANPDIRLRIAGHTDSRGSDEYNLALGSRRAASVKAFLSERGVDGSRMEIVSFGKERPTCTEEEESCWSRNRRAEFELTAGGQNLTLPNSDR
ncbi:peptidoglycan-associated lipoprotein [Gemmatirosa kalamazoonensis]|uniref:Peptidoglycan-associated lipoprotein n=1 Tax=Gemmatirosa kalamazoonensis TaxID=861299 RepID=W0RKW8_9BACT|nr:peptidoglycan-associated lipoprotein [Gemmatirosa kalamazoonensis]